MLAKPRVGGHAGPRLRDETVDRGIDRDHALLEFAVGLGRQITPDRKRRENSTGKRRKDLVEMLLNDVVIRFERANLGTEGQSGDGIDGVAHQVGLQIDGGALLGGHLPAGIKPLRDRAHRGKVALDMSRVEAGHHHAPLPAPDLAAGVEYARCQSDFGADLLKTRGPAKAIGPIAKGGCDHFMVGHHQHSPATDLQLIVGTKFTTPGVELLVKMTSLELQHIAEPGQTARGRQIGDLPQRRGGGRRLVGQGCCGGFERHGVAFIP